MPIFKLVTNFCKNQCYTALGIEDRYPSVYIKQCIYPLALQFPISFKIIGFGICLWLSKLVLCRFLQENHQFFEVFDITRTSGFFDSVFLFQRSETSDSFILRCSKNQYQWLFKNSKNHPTQHNTGKNLRFRDTMRHVFKLGTIFQPFASCGQGLINITIILYRYGEWEEC